MTSTNFDKLDLRKNLSENEISIDDLMAAKWEKTITSSDENQSDVLSARPRSQSNRLEHRLESITKMLEESAKELTTSPKEIPDVQATTSIFGNKIIHFNLTLLNSKNNKFSKFHTLMTSEFFRKY